MNVAANRDGGADQRHVALIDEDFLGLPVLLGLCNELTFSARARTSLSGRGLQERSV